MRLLAIALAESDRRGIIDSFADPELQLFLSRQIGDDGAHAQNTRLQQFSGK